MSKVRGDVNLGVLKAVRIVGSESALGLAFKVKDRTVSNWLHKSIPTYRITQIIEWSNGVIKPKDFFEIVTVHDV
jgi:hypothetical protein